MNSFLKRVIDLAIAVPALIVTSPLQIATATAVRISMGSPVFFRQERPGKNGEIFELIKFRSMLNVDESRGLVEDSERLTKIGKFIRSTSLDELPTLINIIKGDMSLVGPRPLRTKYLERYTPEQARRHDVRPGLTGLAQVNGRNSISWEERFAYDTYYVDHQSLWLDFQIIIKTVGVVFSRQGISEDGQATMTEFLGSSGEAHPELPKELQKQPLGVGTFLRQIVSNLRGGKTLEEASTEVETALRDVSSVSDNDAITDLIQYAKENVPFYQNLADANFNAFPVQDKYSIKENLEAHLSFEFDRSKLGLSSTSGSTGVPFTVYFDPGKEVRHRANLLGTYRFLGMNPYAPLVHSRSWQRLSVSDRIVQALKGHFANSRISHDKSSVEEIYSWLSKRRGVGLMGYTAMTENLMRELENQGKVFAPGTVVAVIGGSEPATGYLAEASERLFGIKPKMRYSMMEMGIVGVTGESLNDYHIDTSSFFVEILNELNDEPVEPGEIGRIVITDLFNRAMPLIRYDTGDLGKHPLDVDGREIKSILSDIRGRRLDLLVGGTEQLPIRLHPLAIWGPMAAISEINQFQLQQKGIGRFLWVLNAEKTKALESKLRAILDERIGSIRECNFEYVDEVPVLASGKRQFFVSEIENPESLFVE